MDTRAIFFLIFVLGVSHCELVNLSCKDISKIVDYHNSVRLKVANGKVPGQPAASKMNSMVWDEKLAEKAAAWSEKGIYDHNPNRADESGRFETGENIYIVGTSAANKDFNFDLDLALDAWFNEYKDYKFTPIPRKKNKEDKMIGHYTQMVWADTVYVGCALSKFLKGGDVEYFIVCNYGPGGNFQGQLPYESAQAHPSGQLDCGAENCSKPYGPMC